VAFTKSCLLVAQPNPNERGLVPKKAQGVHRFLVKRRNADGAHPLSHWRKVPQFPVLMARSLNSAVNSGTGIQKIPRNQKF
jgi:hypothetical protein